MTEHHVDVVTTYPQMKWWRDRFFEENGPPFMIVLGSPGSGKSQMFRNKRHEGTLYLSGSLSACHFYRELYTNLNNDVVIDDVDSFFHDKATVNLMKCLCNTDDVREVFWGKRNKEFEASGVPARFQTNSRVCILANTIATIEENLAAVLDRAFVIRFEPPVDQLHAEVSSWAQDQEVYEFIGDHLKLITAPSMRVYAHAEKMKQIGGDWRAWLLRKWFGDDVKLAAVAQIMSDPTIKSSDERVKQFSALTGGGSRATFMRKQAEWKRLFAYPQRG